MIAHSAAVCQCSSRIPPAFSLMLTPAIVFETGSSRTVTSLDHPPANTRLFERENGYLQVGTPPASDTRGMLVSVLALSRALSVGPGSVRVAALPVLTPCWAIAGTANNPAVAATAPVPNSKKVRLETSFLPCLLILIAPFDCCSWSL